MSERTHQSGGRRSVELHRCAAGSRAAGARAKVANIPPGPGSRLACVALTPLATRAAIREQQSEPPFRIGRPWILAGEQLEAGAFPAAGGGRALGGRRGVHAAKFAVGFFGLGRAYEPPLLAVGHLCVPSPVHFGGAAAALKSNSHKMRGRARQTVRRSFDLDRPGALSQT
jgi:hypothetical protein